MYIVDGVVVVLIDKIAQISAVAGIDSDGSGERLDDFHIRFDA
jgi:hypothetical protein